MAIAHVVAGNVARAAEQNALIDVVNTNTDNVASNTTAISDRSVNPPSVASELHPPN